MTRQLTPETDYGIFRCGEENRNAKLIEEDVQTIRRLLEIGYMQKEVAEVFKVSQDTISKINTGKTWRWM